jgi:GTP-binding protein Era
MAHKAGFVNIIGRPNVGKSTLANVLVGERLSIITHKPQTTRHRILGIVNEEDFQIVFSDTPGYVKDPAYKMHFAMNSFVQETFNDADVIIFMTDTQEKFDQEEVIFERLKNIDIPKFLIINKVDLVKPPEIIKLIQKWTSRLAFDEVFPLSAMKEHNTKELLKHLVKYLPESEPYYPKDQLTDRSERFFVSEIVREGILKFYQQEIPYHCEVIVDRFKEDEVKDLTRIWATIYVGRDTHKSILVGKGGKAIKQLGIEARKGIEAFLLTQVFLNLNVKVRDNWRDDEKALNRFGY